MIQSEGMNLRGVTVGSEANIAVADIVYEIENLMRKGYSVERINREIDIA